MIALFAEPAYNPFERFVFDTWFIIKDHPLLVLAFVALGFLVGLVIGFAANRRQS